jgi:hypothetical protein
MTFLPVSEWEFHEAVRRTRHAMTLPYGEREHAKRSIAADYGVCTRTLERWATHESRSIQCGDFEALFLITRKPVQVTPWEKVA